MYKKKNRFKKGAFTIFCEVNQFNRNTTNNYFRSKVEQGDQSQNQHNSFICTKGFWFGRKKKGKYGSLSYLHIVFIQSTYSGLTHELEAKTKIE